MKLAIFAIVALAGVTLAAQENIFEKAGHQYNHDRRTGVFQNQPFLDLYKHFSTAFVAPTIEPAMEYDDSRYYRPSKDICVKFFTSFVNQNYKIDDFDEFVVLDACLGYVMDGVYKAEYADPEHTKVPLTEQDVADFDALAADPAIATLYKTRMSTFSPAEKTCVADLMLRAILARKSYPSVLCNNHMTQIYIQFAECQEAEGNDNLTPKSEDPYVKMIYDLLRERVDVCFEEEVKHIENAVRKKFAKSVRVPYLSSKLTRKPIKKQQYRYMWPIQIVKVLSAVENVVDKPVILRQIHQIISHIGNRDEKMKSIFLKNLGEFATREIEPRRLADIKKKNPAFKDFTGVDRYNELVDEMCNPFRIATSEKEYSFALSLVRMVQLLNHKDLFNVDNDKFLKAVVKQTKEVGPVYLATYSCNLITFTQGTYSDRGEGRPQYVVKYKPDVSKMVVWPTAEYL